MVMSRICPNCNYTRKVGDYAPDWQCPACEKAYNKGSGAKVDENYGRYASAHQPVSSKASGLKWLIVLIVLGAGVWSVQSFWAGSASPEKSAVQSSAQPDVLLYATEWCGYCAAAREFFSNNGIRYTELDIEKSSVGADGHRKLGGNGVPLIVVGAELVHGYDEARLRGLLKPWIRR